MKNNDYSLSSSSLSSSSIHQIIYSYNIIRKIILINQLIIGKYIMIDLSFYNINELSMRSNMNLVYNLVTFCSSKLYSTTLLLMKTFLILLKNYFNQQFPQLFIDIIKYNA